MIEGHLSMEKFTSHPYWMQHVSTCVHHFFACYLPRFQKKTANTIHVGSIALDFKHVNQIRLKLIDTVKLAIASCIKRVAKDVLGESRGSASPCKNTSWRNEEVKLPLRSNETLIEI